MARLSRTTSERGMPSLCFWRRGPTCSAQRRSWCTALTPMAPCAWLRNCGAREDRPSTFPFIFWKTGLETSGHGNQVKRKKGKGKTRCSGFAFLLFSFVLGLVVARDGIEPPPPAFSGCGSTVVTPTSDLYEH